MQSPVYDLLNTKIHVDDTDFALNGGLLSDDFQ
jgi:serine/threonine-protein kinase HipA